jgi:hypothetical protein
MKDEYKILRLTYQDGYSVQETADLLGIKYEACKKRIQVDLLVKNGARKAPSVFTTCRLEMMPSNLRRIGV